MTNIKDFFGSESKTVLNKPYLNVQERYGSGVNHPQYISGLTLRNFNTMIDNDIDGAAMQGGLLILPAGEYYVDCDLRGPSDYNSSHMYVQTRLVDGSGNTLLIGQADHLYGPTTSFQTTNPRVSGKLKLTSGTSMRLAVNATAAGYSIGDHEPSFGHDYYVVNMKVWKLDSSVETVVISDPEMTLKRPFFHAQDQKPSGTANGTSVIGVAGNDRDLNSVLVNEISGASLSNNLITLPAGTYRIRATSSVYAGANAIFYSTIRKSDDTVLARGTCYYSYRGDSVDVDSSLVLTETTQIKINTYTSTASTSNGLGVACSTGDNEVYCDVMIWKEDELTKTPVLNSNGIYPLPGTAKVVGNMYGLEYAKTGDNQVTVQPGTCMDALNTTLLSLTAQQVVTIGTVINQIYNLFICDDGVVRTDIDVDGANLGAYKFRWIGFVCNHSDGIIRPFLMSNNTYTHSDSSKSILQSMTSTRAVLDISLLAPSTRVSDILMGIHATGTTNAGYGATFYRGSDTAPLSRVTMNPAYGGTVWTSGGGEGSADWMPWGNGDIEHVGSTLHSLCLRAVKLAR